MHPISLAWKPPPTFSYDSLPKELNVHLIHRGTGYEVQAKILTNPRGVAVKHLIRYHCLHACSPDLVAEDPSLPALVEDDRLQLFIRKEGKTEAGTDHPRCSLLDAWPLPATMLMLTGDLTFAGHIVVEYMISPSSPPLMTPITALPCLRSWETNIPVIAKLVFTKITEQGIGFITGFLRAVSQTPPEDPRRKKLMEYFDNCHYHTAPMPHAFLERMRTASQ